MCHMDEQNQKRPIDEAKVDTDGQEPVAPDTQSNDVDQETPENPVDVSDDQGGEDLPAPVLGSEDDDIEWTSSEYVSNNKGILWYVFLGVGALVLMAFAYFVMHDIVAVVALGAIALILGYLGARKPRTMNYRISIDGVYVATKFFPYSDFKSFGILNEGAFSSLVLTPIKRFMPPLSIYYPPEMEKSITEQLGKHLPLAPVRVDLVDSTMRKIGL